MLDFSFFRSRTSVGANIVAFLVTFAMFAQFFFLTLYMQNVLHYSPLQTGIRFLPSTLVIIVMGPLAGRLDRPRRRAAADDGRAGDRRRRALHPVALTVHSGYGLLLPGFILMGLGMGLVMSPMSTAAMNAVDRTKAGAASGVLSMSRMVGGTFGVAVMGALVATIGALQDRLEPPPRPGRHPRGDRQRARQRRRRSAATPRRTIVAAANDAFVSALGTGLVVGALVTLFGAVLAWMLIRPRVAAPAAVPARTAARQAVEAGEEAAAEISLV